MMFCPKAEAALTYAAWEGGNLLIPIMLRSHLPSASYDLPPLYGDLQLKVGFHAPLAYTVDIIVLTVSATKLGLTNTGQPILDHFAGS